MEEGGLSMINVGDLQKSFLLSLEEKKREKNERKRWKIETNSNGNDVQAR